MQYRIASAEDIELLMQSRLATLRDVNHLERDYSFSNGFLKAARDYFLEGDQTTVWPSTAAGPPDAQHCAISG